MCGGDPRKVKRLSGRSRLSITRTPTPKRSWRGRSAETERQLALSVVFCFTDLTIVSARDLSNCKMNVLSVSVLLSLRHRAGAYGVMGSPTEPGVGQEAFQKAMTGR